MQGIRDKPQGVGNDLPPLLAGVAFAISGTGIALALTDVDSPLRAPFILFFLFVGPASGLYAALEKLDPATRVAASAAGAVGIDLAVAGALSALEVLTVDGGVTAIVVVTALLFLWTVRGSRNGRPRMARGTDRADRGLSEEKPERIGPFERLRKTIKENRSGRSRN
ncbi:hypothetical protein [Streptomyces sp. NPDC004726]